MRFIRDKGLVEKFSLKEIKALAARLPEQSAYTDESAVVEQYVRERRQHLQEREGILNQLMGLSIYIPLLCSNVEGVGDDSLGDASQMQISESLQSPQILSPSPPPIMYTSAAREQPQRQDLMHCALDFVLKADAQNRRVLLLYGQSGGGKSLFLVQLMRELNRQYKQHALDTYINIIYFKFREFCGTVGNRTLAKNNDELQQYLTQRVQQIKKDAQNDHNTAPILVLADAYDEYYNNEVQQSDKSFL